MEKVKGNYNVSLGKAKTDYIDPNLTISLERFFENTYSMQKE